ncbi:MAG: type II toxin-antitoxin system HicB family antitoxin [Methanosarcinales archaeon Met12]|nr:MAG: type II toxin-antitoxin system HicB family antitoxin [Methanosarcinales archaeon Met12]
MFIAECPSLPGCISQGKTRGEALENIKDATRGYLESLKKHNEPIPPSKTLCTGFLSRMDRKFFFLSLLFSFAFCFNSK